MLIYDVEIKHPVPGKEERIPGIRYCEGWDDFEGMGIAVIGCYDYMEQAFRVFCEDNLEEFQGLVHHHLDSDEVIVGFNSLKFDNPLVRAHGIDLPDDGSYDLLVEIWKGAGLGPKFNKETHMGYGLGDCVKRNFLGLDKMGNGALAPVLWQQGKVGTVIDYCLSDVWLTKMLLDRVLYMEGIYSPIDGSKIPVKRPYFERDVDYYDGFRCNAGDVCFEHAKAIDAMRKGLKGGR